MQDSSWLYFFASL